MPFFWSVFCLLTVSGTPCPARTAAFYPVEQAAPWRARHLLAEKPGKFSPENLRDKMPRKAVYPAFQGSGSRLHCLAATRLRGPFQSGLGLISSKPAKQSPCGMPSLFFLIPQTPHRHHIDSIFTTVCIFSSSRKHHQE